MGWFVSGKKTKDTTKEYPEIIVRERLKKIEIKGYSRMVNPDEFYEGLLQTLEDYFQEFKRTLILDLRFEYINTSSSKWLLNTLCSLASLANNGLIEINWYYEEDDETIRETGEIFQSSLNIPMYLRELR
ncbi:MAG: DUF1987 domain-containing protein [Bacteroidales bacterium]|nr:DUF1987 domain-containing protein [Bacteroidales bacterium]